jgi:hypothetical protein
MTKLFFLLLLSVPVVACDPCIGVNNEGMGISFDMTQSTPSGSVSNETDTTSYNDNLHITVEQISHFDCGNSYGESGSDGGWSAKDL